MAGYNYFQYYNSGYYNSAAIPVVALAASGRAYRKTEHLRVRPVEPEYVTWRVEEQKRREAFDAALQRVFHVPAKLESVITAPLQEIKRELVQIQDDLDLRLLLLISH